MRVTGRARIISPVPGHMISMKVRGSNCEHRIASDSMTCGCIRERSRAMQTSKPWCCVQKVACVADLMTSRRNGTIGAVAAVSAPKFRWNVDE